MIGIYIHVPFCRTLCPYCDFNRVPIEGAPPDDFIDALVSEINGFSARESADTLFFGGGTPSLLQPRQLTRILNTVNKRFTLADAEITIEANPDDVTPSLATAWRDLGINRVSLGVQSFDDASLQYLGRRHDADTARRACAIVKERFENWSIDLIFGAHPASAWADTLEECARLGPAHVSCYGLTYEPATPFGARASEAIDEDHALACYRLGKEFLLEYERYEISNFARPGYECRHNLRYWRNLEYAGFGPGAFSFIDGVRSMNEASPSVYIQKPGNKTEASCLSAHETKLETLIQHFRLTEGIGFGEYAQRFRSDIKEDFGASITALLSRGLLQEDDGRVKPTDLGFELNNEIGLALVG